MATKTYDGPAVTGHVATSEPITAPARSAISEHATTKLAVGAIYNTNGRRQTRMPRDMRIPPARRITRGSPPLFASLQFSYQPHRLRQRRQSRLHIQRIADTSNGSNVVALVGAIERLAKATDMDIHRPKRDMDVPAPHALQELST